MIPGVVAQELLKKSKRGPSLEKHGVNAVEPEFRSQTDRSTSAGMKSWEYNVLVQKTFKPFNRSRSLS
jgi:hypothetical protein